ncbi:MAG: xanthine phosphoribosyltransferase [Bacilli bacterium]|nr:xanthine phosphoribosyltransferase [Bacilli bacterium]
MKNIEERILRDGQVIDNDILKVDSFLNHQVDIAFLQEFAQGVRKALPDVRVDKVLTIETSGIAVAYALCEAFGCPSLVFAKKSKSKTVGDDVFKTQIHSFTRGFSCEVTVSNKYLREGENVLIADDFLALGNASLGLLDLCAQAGAHPVAVAVVIEKLFQGGRERIEAKGVPVFSGAGVKAFVDGKPAF